MDPRRPHTQRTPQLGVALIFLIGLLIGVGLLSAGILTVTTTTDYGTVLGTRQVAAYYLAESGARYAVPQIRADPDRAITDLHGKSYNLGDGRFVLSLVDNGNEVRLESTGILLEGGEHEVNVTSTWFVADSFNGFDYASCAISSISVANHALIDGDACIVSGPGNVSGTISGNTDHVPDATLNPTPLPPGGTPDTLNLGPGGVRSFSTGSYRLPNISLGNNAVISITGNVVWIVTGPITMGNGVIINLDGAGSLTIYVDGNIDFGNLSNLNTLPVANPAKDFLIYGGPNCTTVNIGNNTSIRAGMLVPTAAVTVQNNASIFGSIIADTLELRNNATLTYDPSLADVQAGSATAGGVRQYL